MSTIKKLIATVVFSGIAIASFAQAPAAASNTTTAPVAAASKPAHAMKKAHKVVHAKKVKKTAPAASAAN
jgi:hypothetical protein